MKDERIDVEEDDEKHNGGEKELSQVELRWMS